MVEYNRYPAMDANYNFPPAVREAIYNSSEFKESVKNETNHKADIDAVADFVLGNAPGIAVDAANRARSDAGIVLTTDDRLPLAPEAENFSITDSANRAAFEVTPKGETKAYDLHSKKATLAGVVIEDESDLNMSFVDQSGHIALQIRSDGTVLIPAPVLGGAGGGGGSPINRVIFQVWVGASNAEGRGKPYNAQLDPVHPRIKMWNWANSAVVDATVPLSSRQQQTGLSAATVVARLTAKDNEDAHVIIMSAGVGGTALYTDASQGVWDVNHTGPNPGWFNSTVEAVIAAKEQISKSYGLDPIVQIFYMQGSGEARTLSTHIAGMTLFIDTFRSRIKNTKAPFVMLNRVPEDNSEAIFNTVIAGQIEMQKAKEYTAFVDGPPNSGGSSSVTDVNHYHREGVEGAGELGYEGLLRSMTNYSGVIPHSPRTVSARLVSGKLTITWPMPHCRVTDFVVEYSIDNGTTWKSVARTISLWPSAEVALTTTSPVLVRVATKYDDLTSAFTKPIIAIGA